MNPFFSVIIPTFNRAHILPETINSVLNQTFTDFEIIVVDDGSTDNTKEIVANINDNKINYIYQKNSERSAARNNGIKNAKGKYICFLDSDDFFEKNHLSVLYNYLTSNSLPLCMVFTDCFYFENENITKPQLPFLSSNPIIYFLLNPVIPARVCVHHEILKDVNFNEDIVIVEDTVLWINIANKYPVFHLQEHTVLYHLHDENSINIKKNCFLPRLKGLRKLFNQAEISKKIPNKLKNSIISDCYYGIARHHNFKRNFWKMIWNLKLSFLYKPLSKHNKAKIYMIYNYILNK